MKSSTSDASQTTNDISRHIDQWKLWITGIGALLICAYVVWFGVIVRMPPTNDPDKFGTFGDFFGGLSERNSDALATIWQTLFLAASLIRDGRGKLWHACAQQQQPH